MNTYSLFALFAAVSSTAFAGVSVTNDCAVMTFDGAGRVTSLVERASGRELAGTPKHFVYVGDVKYVTPEKLEPCGSDTFKWTFPANKGGGEVVLSVKSFGPGWEVVVVSADVPGSTALYFGQIQARHTKYQGRLTCMYSDDESALCVRSYTADSIMTCHNNILWVKVPVKRGYAGKKLGIIACPRKDIIPALRKLTEVAGAPRTVNGGAWSLGAEANRGSYVFADLYAHTVDDWIDFALRGGFDTIHLHGWWDTRGHYDVNPHMFPGGIDDWTNVAHRIHAAGLKVGMHTLTAGIQPRDKWVSGEKCSRDFIDWCVHTLAKPFGTNDTEIVVEEAPGDVHHTFHSYGSHGNTLRIGDEAVTYSGIRREKPYAFTGVKRGAYGRKIGGPYLAGTQAHYLYQRYDAFYPDPDSQLMEDLAAAIGKMRDAGEIDQIYLDGAEAMLDNQINDLHRQRIVPHLAKDMLIEGSNGDAYVWWFLSRYGAWDRPYWGVKRMHDDHLRDVERARTANLLEPQMGWWHPTTGSEKCRGHFLDEMEYFAAKNTGVDTSMSIQGVGGVSALTPMPFSVMRQITLLGWYERFRMARAFTDGAVSYFRQPRSEARLRQDDAGDWRLTPVTCIVHRVTGGADGSEVWNVRLDRKASAAIRVESLYVAHDDIKTNAVPLLTLADKAQMQVCRPQPGKIDFEFAEGCDSTRGKTFKLTARNRRGSARAACVYVERNWTEQPYYSIKNRPAFGVWVKGDGKGALLAIELATPKLYHLGRSPHFVKLDFTGWRHFTFLLREREASEAYEHIWPYGLHPMIVCATPLNIEHLSNVRIALNNLPVNEQTEVELSELMAFPIGKNVTDKPVLSVNGRDVELPFALASGEFAELEGGQWRRYSEQGELMRVASGPNVSLEQGDNVIAYRGVAGGAQPSRVETTLFALGSSLSALKPRSTWTAEMEKALSYEAVMPSVYAPSRGLVDIRPVVARPNEKARVEMTVFGPVANPTLVWAGDRWTFRTNIAKGQRLFCRDGLNWYVQNGKRETVAAGKLEQQLPVINGMNRFNFESSDPKTADARIDVVKRYVTDIPTYFDRATVKIKSTLDGTLQPSYFFPAKTRPGEKAPLLVAFHTWSYDISYNVIYHATLAECRKRGWSLLCPNFRGPNKTPQGCGSDLAVQDVVDAVNWAKANHPIDEDRVYAMGGSGGGHMTLLMAGRHPDIWAGCCAFCPLSDLAFWHPRSKALGHEYWRHLELVCGGTPEEKPEEYARRSPVTYLARAKAAGVNISIATGIHDGHVGKGSVPVSLAMRAFNVLADEKDRISEATMNDIDENEKVPQAELFRGHDPFYSGDYRAYLKRTSGNAQVTIFEGGHGGSSEAGFYWLDRQRRGVKADWTLPGGAGGAVYNELTK
ncbi:MAG: prolyl oligopeptidase family serine peptidase [Kiritimatiellae bacterium]|nr:prolyl oligopeptidase family serine peptidase [Kiritimatiellia bacterium]